MKKSIQSLASFILASALLLSGCVSPRLVTLPDGSKVAPAPTYLPAQAMQAKGKNSYGVPETSFAFYPNGWAPSEASVSGIDKKKWAELSTPEGSRFRPANMPDWDRSNGDPLHIRHDCFSVERLFVVPWGSGEGEVGMYPPGGEPEGMNGFRWLPYVAFDDETGHLWLWDSAKRHCMVFGLTGALQKSWPCENVEKLGKHGKSGDSMGQVVTDVPGCKVYLPDSGLNFFSGKDSGKKMAAPEWLFDNRGTLYADPPNGSDRHGNRFVVSYMDHGIEIYRYARIK